MTSRMERIKPSGTLRMANMAAEMRRRGVDVISFSVGEPDFKTPEHICEAAMEALERGETHYTPSAGIMSLREAIARKSRDENGIPCEASNVLVTPAKQAIFMAMMALLEDGDEVIVPDPGWVSYDPCVCFAGGRPVPVGLDEGFQMTSEAVGEAITPKTRMIVLNSPSNPTGAVAREGDLKGMADLARDHDLLVLADEIYEKLVYEGRHVSIGSFEGMLERTITVNGFSKAYAMTGWRLGWLVAPEHIFKEVARVQAHSITCCTSFAQAGGLAALESGDSCVSEMVREFRARRDLLMGLVEDVPGLRCERPEGAFYLFPSYEAEIGSDELAERLLKEGHVALTPGAAFGAAGEGHIRISYATSRENIEEGMERIKGVLGSIQ